MTSYPIRDQINDYLLTSKNAAMIFIDYQPAQVADIASIDRQLLVDNVVRVAKLGKAFDLPIVLSTVNVKGGAKPTVPPLKAVLRDEKELDRTTINAWEDKEFLEAVEATGRKKLIMCALWTEACLILPSLDALRDGYDVYPVVDAVGGTSLEAHQYALQRIAQAGGKFESWTQLMCELQRDWSRSDTIQAVRQIAFGPDSPMVKNQQRPWDVKGVPAPQTFLCKTWNCLGRDCTMPYSISTLLTRNLTDVFGENDSARRRVAINEIFTEDCVFYEPGGVHRGRDEIDRVAGKIRATHHDFRYQPTAPPEEMGNGGRVHWVEGRPDEAPVYAGTDFIIARNGRIAAIYLFFDKLP